MSNIHPIKHHYHDTLAQHRDFDLFAYLITPEWFQRGYVNFFLFWSIWHLKTTIKYIKWFFSIGYFERCVNWKSDYLELLLSVYFSFCSMIKMRRWILWILTQGVQYSVFRSSLARSKIKFDISFCILTKLYSHIQTLQILYNTYFSRDLTVSGFNIAVLKFCGLCNDNLSWWFYFFTDFKF